MRCLITSFVTCWIIISAVCIYLTDSHMLLLFPFLSSLLLLLLLLLLLPPQVDMGPLMEMRGKHKEEFEKKHGVKLGFMSAFVKVGQAAGRGDG
jgi:hypothetical protein